MTDDKAAPAPVVASTGVLQEVPKQPAPTLILGGMITIIMVVAVIALWAAEIGPFEPAVAVGDPTGNDIGGAFSGDAVKVNSVKPAPKKSASYQEFKLDGATPVPALIPAVPVSGPDIPVSAGLSPALAAALSGISGQISGIDNEVKNLRRDTRTRFDRVDTRLMYQKRRLIAMEENYELMVERLNVMEQHQAQMQSELLTGLSFGKKEESAMVKVLPTQVELVRPVNFNEIPNDVIAAIRQVVLEELKSSGHLKITSGYAVNSVAEIAPSNPINAIASVDPLVPFELISVEAWDNEDMAVISLSGRVATLALHQVRMNYRLVLVSRASGTAQFLNLKTKRLVTLKIS